ncbi:MAG: NlpC/P60 family protein [bacterium]|nr:NlpC/P60 family protein [bacterium]
MNANAKIIIELGRSMIGIPYKYAVSPEEMGLYFDCSSLTQRLYKHIGIDIPRSTLMQATIGKEIPIGSKLEIGDLLFYQDDKGHYNDKLFPNHRNKVYIGHVALYIGNQKAIHATGPDTHNKIVEEKLKDIADERRGPIVMIKRVL